MALYLASFPTLELVGGNWKVHVMVKITGSRRDLSAWCDRDSMRIE